MLEYLGVGQNLRPRSNSFSIAGVSWIDEKLMIFTSVCFCGSGRGTKNDLDFVAAAAAAAAAVDGVVDVVALVAW